VGGEEELLALDLASAGWGLCYVGSVVAHHHPSPARNPGARRQTQARNQLWCAWLRRSPLAALRVSASAVGPAAADRHVRAGALEALRSAGWALRHRRPVPPEVERALRALERAA
jgi:hypothetical protein